MHENGMINVKSGWTNLDKFWNCGHIGKEISTLDVSLRTIDTLEDYQNELINNILAKDFMDTNEEIINQVDSVTQLLSDILQDFVRVEIDLASKKIRHLSARSFY